MCDYRVHHCARFHIGLLGVGGNQSNMMSPLQHNVGNCRITTRADALTSTLYCVYFFREHLGELTLTQTVTIKENPRGEFTIVIQTIELKQIGLRRRGW